MKTIPIVKQILGMLANLFSLHKKERKGFEMKKILLVLMLVMTLGNTETKNFL